MEDVSSLKIMGMDNARPTILSSAPYIELVFKLSHKAPVTWCQDFNLMFDRYKYSVRVDVDKGVFIETWVRNMEEIGAHFELLKTKVAESNLLYVNKQTAIEMALVGKTDNVTAAQGEQLRFNAIISELKFD